MLLKTTVVKTTAVDRLIQSWAQLYTPDLRAIAGLRQPPLYGEVLAAFAPDRRAATAIKLGKGLIDLRCEVASIQTSSLYTYMQSVMDLREVKRLAAASMSVYQVLIELYQQNALAIHLPQPDRWGRLPKAEDLPPHAWGIPNIEALATALEPCLLEFQQEHQQASDWRALGFLTTQLNFCNQWILWKLTPIEALLLRPYLQFVEEQIACPWQRVCAAAVRYPNDSPVLAAAEHLIPIAGEIAEAAYQRLVDRLPKHRSRRGALDAAVIAHSCIRDLKMFQAYFWLSVLRKSLLPIEQELLDLCIRVLPSIGVKWELTQLWMQVLTDELLQRLDPTQQAEVEPYTTGMQQAFLSAKKYFDTPLARSIG